MPIQVGDQLPEFTFQKMGADGVEEATTFTLFADKKVVLVSVPGAFTPTCHHNHVPGYLEKLDQIKSKGVDSIVVTAVNDAYVMGAWAKSLNGADKIEFLADGNGEFIEKLGLQLDASKGGLGQRGQRFVMVVDDGKVTHMAVDQFSAKMDASNADELLKVL